MINQSRCLSTTNPANHVGSETTKETAGEWYCTEDSCINLPKEADVVIIGLILFSKILNKMENNMFHSLIKFIYQLNQ